jgi:hypothetical protein
MSRRRQLWIPVQALGAAKIGAVQAHGTATIGAVQAVGTDKLEPKLG